MIKNKDLDFSSSAVGRSREKKFRVLETINLETYSSKESKRLKDELQNVSNLKVIQILNKNQSKKQDIYNKFKKKNLRVGNQKISLKLKDSNHKRNFKSNNNGTEQTSQSC
mmetsp:Transcript_10931/g.9651  ORF Transcript_10931/g.9651 Transcript_10931/m.9651 type:complete len:111 (+) Transcript_10931:39-371(+)